MRRPVRGACVFALVCGIASGAGVAKAEDARIGAPLSQAIAQLVHNYYDDKHWTQCVVASEPGPRLLMLQGLVPGRSALFDHELRALSAEIARGVGTVQQIVFTDRRATYEAVTGESDYAAFHQTRQTETPTFKLDVRARRVDGNTAHLDLTLESLGRAGGYGCTIPSQMAVNLTDFGVVSLRPPNDSLRTFEMALAEFLAGHTDILVPETSVALAFSTRAFRCTESKALDAAFAVTFTEAMRRQIAALDTGVRMQSPASISLAAEITPFTEDPGIVLLDLTLLHRGEPAASAVYTVVLDPGMRRVAVSSACVGEMPSVGSSIIGEREVRPAPIQVDGSLPHRERKLPILAPDAPQSDDHEPIEFQK
ncbi:hypothetical protein GEU84_020290 [Fertoebacter nigrum]|uniref:Flagellar assembly protein T N-terminal domain-containing protein n=1 Tax=Fertoeibacter niger TaxID=2656921 RepID=A0A8X8H3M4_9RHOB|nr:hypothetical protein [Fertoeibacter niger]NUB46736.1 hypothetical protein [Fertoeibacter niger]